MRLPRDVSGKNLIKALQRNGYVISRQAGSHVRLTKRKPEERHISVPLHETLHIGTLSSILHEVADHMEVTRNELLKLLFD